MEITVITEQEFIFDGAEHAQRFAGFTSLNHLLNPGVRLLRDRDTFKAGPIVLVKIVPRTSPSTLTRLDP